MKIQQKAMAGTMESSDALVTVTPGTGKLELTIQSVVKAQYGDQLEAVVRNVLTRMNVEAGTVAVDDHGAVDCVLEARVETALRRAQGGTAHA